MNIIKVPSGIGDVSWMYSKLRFAEPMHWQIADGWPYRTKQFLELLPGVKSASYGNFIYSDIVTAEAALGIRDKEWDDIKKYDEVFLEANSHLEEGRPLADWLPDLPVDFHYKINTTDTDCKRAELLLMGLQRPLWGVSAASYRGSEAWSTWDFEKWKDFLSWLKAYAGGTIILMGGFWDDLTSALASEGYSDIVGKTSIGTAVEVLRNLNGYIGFSSGLGVLMTVLGRKTFMLWPEHQQPLSTSWAPPEMVESGQYGVSRWDEVSVVTRSVRRWLDV